ncbi:MAG: hypothetical protein U5O39_15480 [Gammaproteobacteria bacterium]|nr:hypothetical protein [Gammaproteobacteria bacterium]
MSLNLKGKLDFVAQTDVGQVRDHNEDYIKCVERLGIGVLADGMGGLNAGEVASSMSVNLLVDELVKWREGETRCRARAPRRVRKSCRCLPCGQTPDREGQQLGVSRVARRSHSAAGWARRSSSPCFTTTR